MELLLDHDLPGDTAWVSLEDYKSAGGTEEEFDTGNCSFNGQDVPCGNNKYGPLTALKHLKQGTDSWNGVVTLTSEDNVTRENGSGGTYTINYEGYKARLINYRELRDIATEEGTSKLPTWLYSNMAISSIDEDYNMDITDIYEHIVYWTDSAHSLSPYFAWRVAYVGYVINDDYLSSANGFGVRPVVKILKSNL